MHGHGQPVVPEVASSYTVYTVAGFNTINVHSTCAAVWRKSCMHAYIVYNFDQSHMVHTSPLALHSRHC